MARRKGESFPSDHRRWFRVMEDILHDPKIVAVGNDGLASFVRLLAMLNQRKSKDGRIDLDNLGLQAMSGKRRADVALTSAQRLADVGLISLERAGDVTKIRVSKWPKSQQLAPTNPRRRPSVSPAPKTTPKTTPTPTKKEDASQQSSLFSNGESGSPEFKAEAAWPAIRAAFAEYGKTVRESISSDNRKLIAKRIQEGATAVDLVAAVHGYVIEKGGLDAQPNGYDPRAYFRPSTIFKEHGFSDRVDAGMGPRDMMRVNVASKAARGMGTWQNG